MPNKKINELSVRTPSLTDLIIVGDPSTGYSYKATITALTAFVGNNLQFANLGGISLTNPVNGQVLQFNGTSWVNYTPSTWNTAYDRSLVSAGVSGTTTKTLTLTKQDGSTLTATWSDLNTDAVTSVFGRTGAVVAAEGDYSLTQLSDVTLSAPSTNQVLQYNGTGWVNATFVAGINSLNGLTATTQTFATGTSGTDFAISSTTSTHTFNLPTASATNRGALSSADWSTFNAKQNAITLTTTGSSGSATLVGATLNIPTYTLAGLGGISLSSLSASAPLSYNSGTGAFSISQASTSTNGFLSSTDWNTFNNKQGAITLTTTGSSGAATFSANTLNIPNYTLVGLGGVSGSGTTNYISKWTSSSALGNSLLWDNGTKDITLGAASALSLGANLPTLNLAGLSDAFTGGIYFRSSANAIRGYIYGTSSVFTLGSETSVPLTFQTAATERMRIFASTGNVSIGTTTDAGYRLDVNGTARVQNNSGVSLFVGNTTGVSTPTPAILSLGATFGSSIGSSANVKLRIYDDGGSSTIYGIGISATILEIQSNANIGFFTGNSATRTERMRISDANGNVGIGTSSPNASALLDVSSTTRGFLPPRMTNAQMTAIGTPASGLMVYDTTNNKLNYYNGTSWVAL